jgi:acyl-coenzyme A synthetase/AMP-(fatty) acid ligase
VNDSDSRGLILEAEFIGRITSVRSELNLESDKYFVLGEKTAEGMVPYQVLFEDSSSEEPGINVDENSCFVVCYTSNHRQQTGWWPHRVKILDALAQAIAFRIIEDDVHLVAAPLCHSGGMFFCLARLVVGGTVCIMRQFDAEGALRLIEEKRITNTFMVPTMYNFILSFFREHTTEDKRGSMRVLICAGAPSHEGEGGRLDFHNAGLIEFMD